MAKGSRPKSGPYRFIGENGSLGYRKEEVYELSVNRWRFRGVQVHRADIFRGYCPYQSVEAFWENWQDAKESGRSD